MSESSFNNLFESHIDTSIFNNLCRTGNSELVKQYLETNSEVANNTVAIGIGFDICCFYNLDTAQWLYNNYKEACDQHIKTTVFFAEDLLTRNKIKSLLWLKSINNKDFLLQIENIFKCLIDEGLADCDDFHFLYDYFNESFYNMQNKCIGK